MVVAKPKHEVSPPPPSPLSNTMWVSLPPGWLHPAGLACRPGHARQGAVRVATHSMQGARAAHGTTDQPMARHAPCFLRGLCCPQVPAALGGAGRSCSSSSSSSAKDGQHTRTPRAGPGHAWGHAIISSLTIQLGRWCRSSSRQRANSGRAVLRWPWQTSNSAHACGAVQVAAGKRARSCPFGAALDAQPFSHPAVPDRLPAAAAPRD